MGHRRIAARVTQAEFPAGFLRLDEPGGRTQIVSPSSVYAIHPTTAEVVGKVADQWRTEPVSRWELEAKSDPWGEGRPDADTDWEAHQDLDDEEPE